jgi:tRNA (guanine37-N1)-methyltransferase
MVVMDAIIRLIPGTLGNENSSGSDSFSDGLLEYAHYTRPQTFEGKEVPGVLLSGHHGDVEKWRLESSLIRTFLKRPDLLEKRRFTGEEKQILKRWCRQLESIVKDDN